VSAFRSAMNWKAPRWRRTPGTVTARVSFAAAFLAGSCFGLPAEAGLAAKTEPIRTRADVATTIRLHEPNVMLYSFRGNGIRQQSMHGP
jgi:hypothetical protein